jgi:hypothetical protein
VERILTAAFLNPNVMSRCDVFDSALFGQVNETPELHPFVATDAGIRRDPSGITVKEILDDTFAKVLPLIDDLIRNVEALCDIPGDADLATTALLPFLGRRDGIVLVFPDLKGNAMHLIAVTDQESCCHRTVDAAAHSEQHRGLLHCGGIVPAEEKKWPVAGKRVAKRRA